MISRMALEISTPSSVSSGLRLISTGKLASIFMQAVQFQPRPHRPRARVGDKGRAMLRMFTPEPLRQQHFDFLPQDLCSLIAKHLLQLRIDQNNLAFTIHDRDRIGCRFQQPAEFLLGLLAILDVGRDSVPSQDVPRWSRSGTARTWNQRYCPSARRKRASYSNGSPDTTDIRHFS